MLGTPYQNKLTFLANLLTFQRILLQRKLDHDISMGNILTYWPVVAAQKWG